MLFIEEKVCFSNVRIVTLLIKTSPLFIKEDSWKVYLFYY
jgi:hypothetical protein